MNESCSGGQSNRNRGGHNYRRFADSGLLSIVLFLSRNPNKLPGKSGRRMSTNTSSSAIAERPRCRVGQLWPKVEYWNWETIFTDVISLYSTTVTYLASKATEFGVKRKKVGTNRKPVCDFLLVITVCTVVQHCCKGRSKKYRKWPFSGRCRRETP